MSKGKKFRKDSQDARRHEQQHEVHPEEKMCKHQEKSKLNPQSDFRRK